MKIVRFKPISEYAKLPMQGSEEAAASDVYASENVVIKSGDTAIVKTGLKIVYIPRGYKLCVYSRSGLAAKSSVFVLNCPGIVDSDYRGELMIILHNASGHPMYVNIGDRIAQIALEKVEPVLYEFTHEDGDETARGAGGLGSTGVSAEIIPTEVVTAEGIITPII